MGISAAERARRQADKFALRLNAALSREKDLLARIQRMEERERELRTTRDRQIERARGLESMLEAERFETLRWRDRAQAARGQIGILRAMAFPQPPDLKSSVQDDDYGGGW